ncbi:MAG: DNA topoisomerase [Sporolactobacillus sp.]
MDQRFPSADKAEALLGQHSLAIGRPAPATIQSVVKKEKREASPRLYSLSDLQARADKVYHISPANTLVAVQALYEAKLLSYPRTDCNFITDGEFTYLSSNLSSYLQLLGVELHNPEMNAKKRYVDGKKVQEHYAIIPTRNLLSAADLDALPTVQRTIYRDVLANTVAMFYPPHVFEETIVLTDAGGLVFKTSGKVERDPGWKVLFSSEPDKDRLLPPVREGQGATATLARKEGVTTPPKPYTEGQLIMLMKTAGRTLNAADEAARKTLAETEGLGTEATRSGIIETLKRQNYIVVRKSAVSVTEKGMLLCDVLSGNKLTSPAFTAEWETYLKKIRLHEGTQERFLGGIGRFIQYLMDEAPKALQASTEQMEELVTAQSVGRCPLCGQPVFDKGKFYGCAGYVSGCKFTLPKELLSKNLDSSIIKILLSGKKTRKLKGFKSKAGKSFDAVLTIQEGKLVFQFDQSKFRQKKVHRKPVNRRMRSS